MEAIIGIGAIAVLVMAGGIVTALVDEKRQGRGR
jgi:hypothetical protein